MNTANQSSDENEELSGVLGLAVAQAREQRPVASAKEEALRLVAEKLQSERAKLLHGRWSRSRMFATISAIAAVLAFVAVLQFWHTKPGSTVAVSQPASVEHYRGISMTTTTNSLHGETAGVNPDPSKYFGTNADGAQHLGGIAAGVQPMGNKTSSAGTSPSRRMAVAGGSTFIVSNGEEDPIDLGQATDGDMSKDFLHVWDFSKSKTSKPLKVSSPGPFAVTPDGSKIVTADGQVIDAKTGEITAIDNLQGKITGLKFSPDGRTLLLQVMDRDAAVARLVEFPSGKLLCEIPHYWHYTFDAGFSSDGKQVALMGDDRFVRRFDASTGKELGKYEPAHTNSVRAVLISDDGKQLASCASSVGEIRVWNIETGKLLHEYQVSQKPKAEKSIDSLAFSHDGKLLAGGGHPLVLWDVASGKLLHTYPMSSWGARYLQFSADDKTLTTIRDFTGTIRNGLDLLIYPTIQAYAVEGSPAGEESKAPLKNAGEKEKAAADLTPLLDKIFKAYGGEEKLKNLTAISEKLRRFEGKEVVEIAQYSVQQPDCYRVELSYPGNPKTMICIFNGHGVRRWYRDAAGKTEEVILLGSEMADSHWLDYIKYYGPRTLLRLKDADAKLQAIDDITLDGKTLAGIQITPAAGADRKMYFDKETGLLAKETVSGGQIYTDHKTFDGIPVPVKRADSTPNAQKPNYTEMMEFKAVEKFDPAIFQKP